jgi:TRAP-type C4-dicarboxylate transport system permease small subunit
MKRLVQGSFRLIDLFIVFCLAGMLLLVFVNVVLRYGFGSGILVSEELSRFMLVWLTFVGGAAAMYSHSHLGMDFVVKSLPQTGKKICAVASISLMLLCLGYFFYGSWQQTVINLDVKSSVLRMPMSFYYGVGLFFSLFAGVVLVNDLYRVLSGKAKGEELVMVAESDE